VRSPFQHAAAPLRDARDGVHLVVDLVEHADVAADAAARDLAGDHEHGRRGGVRGAEPGRGVQQARSRHDERGADAAAGPRVAVGHVRRRLLVARRDEPDRRLVPEAGDGAVELHARETEHHADAFARQLLGQGFAAAQSCHV
jgi:hypothetical protein